ncbi:MAG TPA: lasso peptide biosynthesis B2 protein, partial [Acidimicrobiales bacterium]|nr:lasso peptide biosynthesis B2 protein [Acidimicrobiales bacterium]
PRWSTRSGPSLGRGGTARLVVRMGVWRLALPPLRRLVRFERLVELTAAPRERPLDAARVQAVVRVGRRLWRDSAAPCLERSVCIHRELGLAGAQPTLVLGLAPDHTGHAWVELDGTALLEPSPPTGRYRELMRFDAAGALLTVSDAPQPAGA